MWDSKQLRALQAVAETGSFEQAAEQLGITASAVSQRVRVLEEETGFPLITRSRPCYATVQGQKLLRYIRHTAWLQQEVKNELEQRERPYVWSIAVNHDSLDTWLLPVLAEVAAIEPILPDIQADNEEHTHKLMNEGRVMAAVSTRSQAMAGCEVQYLGSLTYRLLASPVFVERYFANGITRHSLQHAPLLVFDRKDELQAHFLRQQFGLGMGRCAKVYIPATASFFQAVKLGLGYGMIPDWQGWQDVQAGNLMDLCPNQTVQLHLYWHCWKAQSPRLAKLNESVVQAARRLLTQANSISASHPHAATANV